MKYIFLIFFAFSSFQFANLELANVQLSYSQNQETWKLAKNSNNIKIYSRIYLQTHFKEYQAVMVIKTTPIKLLALVKDDKVSKDIASRVKEFKTLKIISDHEWFTYAEISLPFPFQNRDLISRNLVTMSDAMIKVDLLSMPDFLPKNTDKVRMQNSKGFWQFKQLPNNEVEVTYQFFAEPVVALPQWFVAPFIVGSIHSTFEKMREKVQ
jgi:hypothetical protein